MITIAGRAVGLLFINTLSFEMVQLYNPSPVTISRVTRVIVLSVLSTSRDNAGCILCCSCMPFLEQVKVVAGLSAIRKESLNTGALLSATSLTRVYSTGLTNFGPAITMKKRHYPEK